MYTMYLYSDPAVDELHDPVSGYCIWWYISH